MHSLCVCLVWWKMKRTCLQDERNVVNGLGEIMKLALVRSTELFSLLELHGPRLVRERFQVRYFIKGASARGGGGGII